MKVILEQSSLINNQSLKISGSKSQTNRLLLLQKLYSNIDLQNISDADDSRVMQTALNSVETIIDIHHAGTAMRFLTAYFAVQSGRVVELTGSSRMKDRPISILVDALTHLGATIEYLEKPGFPPLRITGKKLDKFSVSLPADISSQYISALLLIAPQMENGLEIIFEGMITSQPYIEMTLAVLTQMGIPNSFIGNRVQVLPQPKVSSQNIVIESDWSSASYFYTMVAFSPKGTKLHLSHFQKNSLQGDSKVAEYFRCFGVETLYENTSITLIKQGEPVLHFEANFIATPDLAQTIAVACFGLGISCQLTGLHTLKIKETDRLRALQVELQKLGAELLITENSLNLKSAVLINSNTAIDTYQDHRMAMAFAPLALKTNLIINDATVVTKSFIHFWENLQSLGFLVTIDHGNSRSRK
ncbi:3-phosphoshikimate 1-carboxyvinyltransferase [Flavobacterium sp. NKUCC04_CG]|uniref:3-phosphoshikimate 1-carboxyvinyltransferase n=1 Tax=Flavobacterium sp. NKUCC04_CG TaxID=2842121 RepID=UPI001C5B5848|nr:3-phosphoshikimate 1-carboxyvinyltransferase [Flavobacterium sp. NKUCC04_CG]MBW3518130.1 3-phosphoshikimate 1-carboxyvinyltransferase [Flavobacterium sp. NKUCC04_CG]